MSDTHIIKKDEICSHYNLIRHRKTDHEPRFADLTYPGSSLCQRRLAQPVFHQQRINGYGAVMVEYTQRMLERWRVGEILRQLNSVLRLHCVPKTAF
jgi:hypothetical protein